MSKQGESCVETPAAPEWLSKLESRREKIGSRGKLGHESGAGAPCNECGDKCPGLDLHFWRKVCRNCKCRKDQHMCQDDDLSGWAQFEILGQIRSKPAYMKIKALADEKVKLDWVPPNATPDVVLDYMDKLGTNQIPVAGSDAAAKRKQQLEFQVPPHDLDAKLCDNLTESETAQLEQYVKKIRENCVGQGNVIRVGEISHGKIGLISGTIDDVKMKVLEKLQESPTDIITDNVVMNLLNSDKLSNALLNDRSYSMPTSFVAFSQPLNSDILPRFAHLLCKDSQQKLKTIPINIATAVSVTRNGPFYDKILTNLANKNLNISKDPVLKPITDFRKEYLLNDNFKNDIDQVVTANLNHPESQYATPLKQKPNNSMDSAFNSPIPVRNPIETKFGSLMKQDTPMRKVKFGGVTIAHDLGLPLDAKIEKDKVLSKILSSEPLRNAVQYPLRADNKNLIIALTPMSPSSDDDDIDDYYQRLVSPAAKMKIEKLGLNKDCVQSGFVNGPCYDQLFRQLNARGINFGNCKLLAPMEQFRQELLGNLPFQKDIATVVQHLPDSQQIAVYNGPFDNQMSTNPFKKSNSSDSGFDSKPPTPNYSTFPGDILSGDNNSSIPINLENNNLDFTKATSGKFSSIPGIEELNMYPSVNLPSDHSRELMEINKNLIDLKLAEEAAAAAAALASKNPSLAAEPVPVLKCKDCEKFIMSGEVAVKAERAGKEIAWHPECFKCNGCRELLADLVYFFHGGNVYCGRDLAIILKIPRCNACDELIFTKEYTAAEGATFHIKHFCCYQCDLPLAGQQYIPDEKTNMPLCLKCYDEYYAEKCQNCKMIIGPTEQGVSWGKIHWHGQCFICFGMNCGKSLIGGRFCVKQDLPFCSPQCVKSILQ